MKYHFPIIETVDQVRNAVEGLDEIKEINRDGYILFDYVVVYPETFPIVETVDHAIRRECRGIAFNQETGEIIRRPFHKFFNINEREETRIENIDIQESHRVVHKYDGSMIAPMIIDDEIIWGTRKILKSAHHDVTDHVHRSDIDYDGMVRKCIAMGSTPIFEFMTPDNIIIVPHEHEELRLLNIRGMKSGKYFNDTMLENIAKPYGVPLAETAFDPIESLSDFVPFISQLKDEREGIIIRFANGHHLKLKTEQYAMAHKAKSLLIDKDVIKMILNDTIDDIMPYLNHNDQQAVLKFKSKLYEGLYNTAVRVVNFAKEFDDEGIEIKDMEKSEKMKSIESGLLKPMVFAARRGASVDAIQNQLVRLCQKWVGSGPRVDAIRPLFGGIRFSDRAMFSSQPESSGEQDENMSDE